MFLGNETSMIICIEEGLTCNTVLSYLNYELIKSILKLLQL